MTRKEQTYKRDLTLSGWIRENLPDSSLGLLVTDLDFILYNYQTKKIMLLEVKTRNAELKAWQQNIFQNLADWITNGISSNWQFLGFHVLKFENTFFGDGRVYLDNKMITEEGVKGFLSSI